MRTRVVLSMMVAHKATMVRSVCKRCIAGNSVASRSGQGRCLLLALYLCSKRAHSHRRIERAVQTKLEAVTEMQRRKVSIMMDVKSKARPFCPLSHLKSYLKENMSSKPNRPSLWLLFPSNNIASMPPKYKGKPSRDISCPYDGFSKECR
ncbi:hypothetical protein HDV64DRAFT_80278 [Trichoderma sp. TUCIM 5745]